MKTVTEHIRVLRFPLSLGGTQIGRTVTLIRLSSGEVVIHSTACFTKEDVRAIVSFGRPAALVEATFFHDTCAREGKAMFPDIPYFAPPGFTVATGIAAKSLADAPAAWRGELEVLQLEGMSKVCEHVFLHPSSRTLIVADLVFNISPAAPWWTRFFFRTIAGIPQPPGVSRIFRSFIRDREAFQRSVGKLMTWNFERVIVGHGEIVVSDAKPKMARALQDFL